MDRITVQISVDIPNGDIDSQMRNAEKLRRHILEFCNANFATHKSGKVHPDDVHVMGIFWDERKMFTPVQIIRYIDSYPEE